MLVRAISNVEKWFLTKQRDNFIKRTITNLPLVTVEQGKLEGSTEKMLDGTPYYSFKGIPYAQPPVGNLRFKAPLPPKPWQDVYKATEHGPVCPQLDMITMQVTPGDENCLFLNVYSKSLKEKQPVIVFLHGGAYMSGSGNSDIYGPEYLVQHDIVLVTLNYRLEALGFLCLDTEDAPGNAGIKDQVAAMKWVKNNISKFGGDPENITLMGESAGAASVTYHLMSPMSRNLFHKGIIQSGVCFCDWAQGWNAKERAFRLGKYLGKETNDVNELLTFLQSVPATDLAKITTKSMDAEEKLRGLPIHFCPVVEKEFPNVEPYLTKDSLKLLLENKAVDIPLIVGYNSVEGAPMLNDFLKKIELFNKELYLKVPREVAAKADLEKLKGFGERIREFYFQGKELSKKLKREMVALESDILFIYCTIRFANIYKSNTRSPLYMYQFAHESELNIMKLIAGWSGNKGAVHADDLFYLFSTKMTKDIVQENENIRGMVNEMTKLWTNFAKTGNPTPDGSLGIEWKPYTTTSKNYLNIASPLSLEQNPNQENVEFWNKIYKDAGVPFVAKSSL